MKSMQPSPEASSPLMQKTSPTPLDSSPDRTGARSGMAVRSKLPTGKLRKVRATSSGGAQALSRPNVVSSSGVVRGAQTFQISSWLTFEAS